MPADPKTPSATPGRTRVLTLALGLLVVALAWLPFRGALEAGFVNWDDDANIVHNESWRGLDREHLTWMATAHFYGHWQPLTWLSYALDLRASGLEPRAFHRTNLWLHALTAGAFFLALTELLRAARGPSKSAVRPLAAAAGALLFALHPLRVESVAWVTERRDVLSGLFWITTVWAYLRARRDGLGRGPRVLWTAVSLGAFALSLLSKAWGITMPAVLILLDVFPLGRLAGRAPLRRVLGLTFEKLPWWLFAAAAAWQAAGAQEGASAAVDYEVYGLADRLAQAAFGLVFYPWRTLVPTGLAPLYPITPPIEWSRPSVWGPAVAALLVTALVFARPLRRRGFAVAWLVFAVVVSPVLGFLQSGSQLVADRYSYLACLPFAALFAGGLEALAARGRTAFAGGVALTAAALVSLSVASAKQTAIWHDSTSLWEACLARTEANHVAHYNLGSEYRRLGRDAEALEELAAAARLRPGRYNYQLALGLAADALGEAARAEQALRAACAAEPDRPEAHAELGRVLLARDRATEAVAAFRRARDLRPDGASHFNLALALQGAGATAAALEEARRAVELEPDDARTHNLIGGLLRELGRAREGARECELALRLEPGLLDAHKNLALIYDELDDAPKALLHLREVVAAGPDVRFAHLYAWRLATAGDPGLRDGAEAVRWAEWVNEKTGYARARFLTTLAAARAEAGDFPGAVRAQERALAAAPEGRKAEHRRRLERLRAGEPFTKP